VCIPGYLTHLFLRYDMIYRTVILKIDLGPVFEFGSEAWVAQSQSEKNNCQK
jgi:hypothetical protein